MYPNNQMPGPYAPPPQQPLPPQNSDPYGFITNTAPGPARNIGPSSMKGRIIVVAVGAVILLIIVIVITTLLGSAGKAQTDRYIEIAKAQTEIVRVATMAQEKTRGDDAKALAATTKLAMTSAQTDTYAILTKKGVSKKALSKSLSTAANAQTDQLLSDAEKNSRYDEAYTKVVQQQLDDYKKLLSDAYNGAAKTDAETLKAQFDQAALLENKN